MFEVVKKGREGWFNILYNMCVSATNISLQMELVSIENYIGFVINVATDGSP